MNDLTNSCAFRCIAVMGSAIVLNACSSTQILDEPREQPVAVTLSTTTDGNLETNLDWVIIRDGPGSWASNVDWDQYLLRFVNLSDEAVKITRVTLVDSLGTRISPRINRDLLVKGTRQTAARYKEADIEVHAGMSGDGLIATGITMAAAGSYVAAYSVIGLLTGTTSSAMLAPAGFLAVYAAPVVAVGSLVSNANEQQLNTEIINRQTLFPIVVPAGTEKPAAVFYPITPSPTMIEVAYTDESGPHILRLDTRDALADLHLASMPLENVAEIKKDDAP